MIDWLTMRIDLQLLPEAVKTRLMTSMGRIRCTDPNGEIQWEKGVMDFSEIRSDAPGLFWQVQGGSDHCTYLVIGASPASLQNAGINVFGSDDIVDCALVLIHHAQKALGAILPHYLKWQCRRVDITENYALTSPKEVKAALRCLLGADSGRTKASTLAGDTVVWNKGSDLLSGKAYHKGPQLEMLARKGRISISPDQQIQADRLLRLELKVGSRWFRRNPEHWSFLTPQKLAEMHGNYFSRFFGQIEVTDMGKLLEDLERVAPTPGQALAAHRTWALIRAGGGEQARASMPKRTWHRHAKMLRAAGFSEADLLAGNILPFRQKTITLEAPVRSWADMGVAA